ncbi:MAG: hypothetical protein P4L43_07230 [Syntrophobacteraceae bacterium]|nr:hypothetical protein [Syntrophobacteraceae bacterium]
MARKSKDTFQKLERQKEKQQKQRDKEARRVESKKAKAERKQVDTVEDLDIAGIMPGPQPLSEHWDFAPRRDGK